MATWTMHEYGEKGSGRWTLTNGHARVDVHPIYDGSRREKYPDGIIVSPAQATDYAEQMLLAFNKFHVGVLPHIPKVNK